MGIAVMYGVQRCVTYLCEEISVCVCVCVGVCVSSLVQAAGSPKVLCYSRMKRSSLSEGR
jgi:hypothetical protein